MAEPRECVKCGEERVIEARGLCRSCYSFIRRNGRLDEFPTRQKKGRRIIECSECGKLKSVEAHNLCQTCYARHQYHKTKHKRGRVITCSFCGKSKKHKAKGMCRACYNRAWRNNGVPTEKRKRPVKIDYCIECGDYGRIKAKGHCRKCYQVQHRQNNRERYRAYDAKYRTYPDYLEKALKYKRDRRHRKYKLPATLTEDQWETILDRYNHSCAYCGAQDDDLQREHWIPVIKGGGYTVDNIVPACKRCNAKKHTMTGDEYLELLERA